MTCQMTRRRALFSLPALAVPTLALGQSEGEAGDPFTVEINSITLPLVSSGALVNFLFCAVIVKVSDTSSAIFLREQSYLLRDAMIKIASRTPIPVIDTRQSFDRVAVTRLVLQAMQAIRPSIRVVRVTVANPAFMR
jgi:hypothetical protein